MLHHVSVGVGNFERAAKFYDAALSALGYKRVMEFLPFAIAYGETWPELWIGHPHNGGTADPGNGVHIAVNAKNKEAVHAFHKAALSAGGTDDGAPGPRPQYTPQYYGAFVRDPDGNKIEAMLMVGMASAAPAKTTAKKAAPKKAKKPAPKAKTKPKNKARKR